MSILCSIELVEGIYGKVSLTKGLLLVCLTVFVIDAHVFQYRYNRRLPSYAALCKALSRSCSKTLCSPLPCTTSVTTAAMHTAVEQTLSWPLRWNSHRPWGRKQRWFRARSYHRFRRTTWYEIEGARQQDNTNDIKHESLDVSFCSYRTWIGQVYGYVQRRIASMIC
jgi:hypothetical protein